MESIKPLTFGSLFAGIGGLDLGLERAGMFCKWQVEVDSYATKVLEKYWPSVARFGDVRNCHGAQACDVADTTSTGEWAEPNRLSASRRQTIQEPDGFRFRDGANAGSQGWIAGCPECLEPVDLICGGFPCQDVSLAGKRQGLKGKRTTLWSEFARIIGEIKPRWVLAENVPGLYSSDSGRFFGRVLRDLAESGYDAEWDCIPAAAVGAPHLRYRVFIVAHADEHLGIARRPEPERFKRETWTTDSSKDVAHANGHEQGRVSVQGREAEGRTAAGGSGEDVADTNRIFCKFQGNDSSIQQSRYNQGIQGMRSITDWWAVEPDVGRVAHGIPSRVDRLRCLGNAVVPQVAEWIGRRIVELNAQGTPLEESETAKRLAV